MAEEEEKNKTAGQQPAEQGRGVITRYGFIALLLVGFALVIVFKILVISFVQQKEWQDIGKKEVERIPNRNIDPTRGNILADDDRLMATSFPLYRIYMDFRRIDSTAFWQASAVKKGQRPDSTARANARRNGVDSLSYYLARKFNRPQSEVEAGLKAAARRKAGRYALCEQRVSYADLREISQFPFIRLGRGKSGFFSEAFVERQKPFGTLASRTIGNVYASLDSSGRTRGQYGLELEYDSLLRGEPGLKETRRIAGAWRDRPIIPAKNGYDIRTTINVDLQDLVEKALLDELNRTEAASGSVVLMDVKTGQVKAITNMQRNASGGYGEAVNHAVADLMEPGSTFKTASIMVALEDGVCTPEDWVNTGNGRFPYGGAVVTDYKAGGFGMITVERAMEVSSNIGVAKTILKGFANDPEKYVDGLYKLGFGEDLHIDIPGAARAVVRRPDDRKKNKTWYPAALAWMAFGYETQIPPIYMLAFYNAIANGGKMMRPYFVTDILKDGKEVESFGPEVVRSSICSAKTLHTIQGILENVVKYGTGKPAYSHFVQIAGKTGTAQIAHGGHFQGNGHYVSFAGYFPADKPEYSCIAVIRQPKRGYPSGGSMSGSVVKEIAEGIYAQRWRIAVDKMPVDSLAVTLPSPKAGNAEALSEVLDALDVPVADKGLHSPWALAAPVDGEVGLSDINLHAGLVPRVLGMGAKDAVYLLESAGLRVSLDGQGRVTAQSAPPGSRFVKGQTVRLTLR
ncbi:MAG: transpeptidase family protein [Tannerella sp.]|jgi:cell division protein FtsI (penicillin-binding protein 3)|nr:transpeptidase family protein [Tannerella sp.]